MRRPRLADIRTDILDVTEFIVPGGLIKATNAEAPKKHRGYSVRRSSGRLGERRTYYFENKNSLNK